jgi:hypothetical protein
MTRVNTAVRMDEAFPQLPDAVIPANDPNGPAVSARTMGAELAGLSNKQLAVLEDELDFYAFTGMPGPYVQRLLKFV